MADPGLIISFPALPTAANEWLNAVFQYLAAPALVGILVAWQSGKSFRHAVTTEKQRSGIAVVQKLVDYGRKLDDRLLLVNKAEATGNWSYLQILGDAAPPDIQAEAVALGPKAAMRFQALRDAFALSNEGAGKAYQEIQDETVAGGQPDIPSRAVRIANAFEDVLLETYRSIAAAVGAAGLPYKLTTRLTIKELETRRRNRR